MSSADAPPENPETSVDEKEAAVDPLGKEMSPGVVVNLVLEVNLVQWYSLANDQRSLRAEGRMQIVGPGDQDTENDVLVFVFPETPNVQYAVSNAFPVMRVADRNYVFPSQEEFYGLVISEDVDEDVVAAFEELLADFSNLRVAEKHVPIEELPELIEEDAIAAAGHKMAHYIRQGAVTVTKGIRHGAKVATIGIHAGKEKLKERIEPADIPVHVSQDALTALQQANAASGVAVKVSGAVLVGTIAAANQLSNKLTEVVAKTPVGDAIASRPSGTKASAAKDIVKSTLSSALTLYDEVAQVGLVLVQETGSATVDLIEHRFGPNAAIAAGSAAAIVNDISAVSVNTSRLGKSALLKRVAANTTIDAMSSEDERKVNQEKRIVIDPATGMQAVMLASQLAALKAEQAERVKQERLAFVGEGDLPPTDGAPSAMSATEPEPAAEQDFVAIDPPVD